MSRFVDSFEFSTMRYSTEILIHLPRTKVIELFMDPGSLQKWQPGLKSFEHLDGDPGEVGCRSTLSYEARKGDLVMTETITAKQLPEQITMTYKSRGVYNEVENWFTEKEPGVTHWRTENFLRFSGVMMLMVPFMKQAFIHNTMLHMDRLKIVAESK
jgi:hypothetical protein